jgi:hypothetical protein
MLIFNINEKPPNPIPNSSLVGQLIRKAADSYKIKWKKDSFIIRIIFMYFLPKK